MDADEIVQVRLPRPFFFHSAGTGMAMTDQGNNGRTQVAGTGDNKDTSVAHSSVQRIDRSESPGRTRLGRRGREEAAVPLLKESWGMRAPFPPRGRGTERFEMRLGCQPTKAIWRADEWLWDRDAMRAQESAVRVPGTSGRKSRG